jgi:hypothetical protein
MLGFPAFFAGRAVMFSVATTTACLSSVAGVFATRPDAGVNAMAAAIVTFPA